MIKNINKKTKKEFGYNDKKRIVLAGGTGRD